MSRQATTLAARLSAMVHGLVDMHLDNFKASGTELLRGSGRFIGPRTIEVALADGGTRPSWREGYLSTGSRTTIEPIPRIGEASPLTHIEALDLDYIPAHLLIVGGAISAWNWPRPCAGLAAE
jgi:pyruvate/2-oxoglutarate dehydrogenase complex dihydrolipoamide dehydrogenase (E3) component